MVASAWSANRGERGRLGRLRRVGGSAGYGGRSDVRSEPERPPVTVDDSAFADLGKVLVIIPTYNESENVEPIVSRVRTAVPAADVLIADD